MKTHCLPIDEILPQLIDAIGAHSAVILHAPPGAGKTTRVPLALLQQIPQTAGKIIMLEPRRLAAVSAARWMAVTLGEEVGQTVGYRIRFENRVSAASRIEVVTEGVLTRMIQHDPLLEGVALVIFDEFHERSLQADLGLALCLDLQRQVRDDLKLLVMSATLDVEPLTLLLGGAPLVSSPGRSYPVQIVYREHPPALDLAARVKDAVLHALQEDEGDLLVFLPGAGEIRRVADSLTVSLEGRPVAIRPLYGELPFEEQQRAILPGEGRKVILATSIAETSLTVEGVRIVIDSGLCRRMRHDQGSGMNRLVTIRESQASAIQRSGRAGRTAPGVCYRLYSQHSYHAMIPHTPAEMLEADLSPLLLELAAWGVSDPSTLQWLDPPLGSSLAVARELLCLLGALDKNNFMITPLGREMAQLPLHPRLSALLMAGKQLACPALACDLAALLSERDIVRSNAPRSGGYHAVEDNGLSVTERLELFQRWRDGRSVPTGLQHNVLKAVERVGGQLRRLIKTGRVAESGEHLVARLLLAAWPDRLAQRREGSSERYLLSNGCGARLARPDRLRDYEMLVAVSVTGVTAADSIIHLGEALPPQVVRQVLQQQIVVRQICEWDSREGRISAFQEESYGALVLTRRPITPDGDLQQQALIMAIRQSELRLLARPPAFYQFQARIMLLRRSFPADDWPDVSDPALCQSLENWLGGRLGGIRNADQLARLNSTDLLGQLLDYRQRQRLEQLAPTALPVPSGSRIRIDYGEEDYPVLAVKLQELFGLAETPTVADGRVPLLLHLLSPAGRPLQVTQDLKGFWDGSYHQVKKEMKGRYPKHPWPDDPWNAVPTRRTKPKSG